MWQSRVRTAQLDYLRAYSRYSKFLTEGRQDKARKALARLQRRRVTLDEAIAARERWEAGRATADDRARRLLPAIVKGLLCLIIAPIWLLVIVAREYR